LINETFFAGAWRALPLCAGAVTILIVASSAHSQEPTPKKMTPRKKLIHVGWDTPSTQYVRDNWQKMEATTPFDGTVIDVKADTTQAFDDVLVPEKKWTRQRLQGRLQDLKAARWTRFTDNFLRVWSTPGTLDWFNDAHWDGAISNIANYAWLAKQAGLKGICFDPESYSARQYEWKPQSGHSFEESYDKARQRGRQMMQAMGREYP
jgi:hypothetical protein